MKPNFTPRPILPPPNARVIRYRCPSCGIVESDYLTPRKGVPQETTVELHCETCDRRRYGLGPVFPPRGETAAAAVKRIFDGRTEAANT